MTPRYTDLIKSLPTTVPFVGPEAIERNIGVTFAARIGANESVFGPSPKAIEAMKAAASETWKYADPENYDLRHALADFHGVTAANIIVGGGIDGLLGVGCRLLMERGRVAVMPDGAYPAFAMHVNTFGGTVEKVPYVDDHESIDGLLAKAEESDASILHFSNPDNPMGTFWGRQDVERLMADLPEGTALFLDEAYGEFAPEGELPPADVSNPMVLRFRTFSKAYGMAGSRVGYVIAHEDVIATMNKVRDQYGTNRIAQIGALAALQDQDWLAKVCHWTAEGRERIYEIAAENGLAAIPSSTNFVAIDCGRDEVFAKAVLDEIVALGIFMRMPFAAPGNRCIRAGVGKPEDLDLFAKALPVALERLRNKI